MTRKPVRGLFITGTDTEIGNTDVGALMPSDGILGGFFAI
jgi:hypothetical protein